MYKIRQVAEILNVSTVQVHEKLIFLKEDLKPYIHKLNSITHIDDKGLVLIKRAFESDDIKKSHSNNNSVDHLITDVDPLSITESELTPIENSYDMKVIELKEKIGHTKSIINKVDLEIKRIDDAINHYHTILEEDFEWRIAQERKLGHLYIDNINDEFELNDEMMNDKKNFFNPFKKK